MICNGTHHPIFFPTCNMFTVKQRTSFSTDQSLYFQSSDKPLFFQTRGTVQPNLLVLFMYMVPVLQFIIFGTQHGRRYMHARQARSKTLMYFLLYFSPPNFLISYITSKFVYFVFINVLHTLPPHSYNMPFDQTLVYSEYFSFHVISSLSHTA